jgi:hypothetical protein
MLAEQKLNQIWLRTSWEQLDFVYNGLDLCIAEQIRKKLDIEVGHS